VNPEELKEAWHGTSRELNVACPLCGGGGPR
jgi:hypothetical protein